MSATIEATYLLNRICRCGLPIPDDKEPITGYRREITSDCAVEGCDDDFCDHPRNAPSRENCGPFCEDDCACPTPRIVRIEEWDLCPKCEHHEQMWCDAVAENQDCDYEYE